MSEEETSNQPAAAAGMKVSLSGALRNAADCIKELSAELKRRMDADDFENLECAVQPDSNIFMLSEIVRHARETAAGEHSIEEFAEFYCLKKSE